MSAFNVSDGEVILRTSRSASSWGRPASLAKTAPFGRSGTPPVAS